MLNIALDLESVLADSNEAALQSTDKLDRQELLGEWDLSDDQWMIYMGVTDAVWRHRPEIVPPEETMIDQYVDAIYEQADRLDIVTAREHVDEQLVWWLDAHGIPYDSFVSTSRPKYEFTEYNVFIDDNPRIIGQVDSDARLFVRNQPWNVSHDLPDNTERIYSLAVVDRKL